MTRLRKQKLDAEISDHPWKPKINKARHRGNRRDPSPVPTAALFEHLDLLVFAALFVVWVNEPRGL